MIVSSLVDCVREASRTGGFVKFNPTTKQWYEVGDAVAREKIGQLLREKIARRNPAKMNERKERRKKAKLAKSSYLGSDSSMTRSTVATELGCSASLVSYEAEVAPQNSRVFHGFDSIDLGNSLTSVDSLLDETSCDDESETSSLGMFHVVAP